MREQLKNSRRMTIGSLQLVKPNNNKFLWTIAFCLLCVVLLFSCNADKKESNNTHEISKKDTSMNLDSVYYCPMDTEIVQNKPGVCPKCNMDLELKPNLNGKSSEDEELQDEYSLIINPVNTSVLSNVKAIKPTYKTVPLTIKASGYINYDPRRIHDVSARIGGRIEKLYVKYTFQPVRSGQALFEIFSHDLLSAQQDYFNLKNTDPDNAEMIHAARKKLLLLGMTESQVNSMKDNGHIHPTTTVYSPYTGYVIEKEQKKVLSGNGSMESSSMMGDNSNKNSAQNMSSGSSEITLREGSYVGKAEPVFKVVNTDIVWGILEVYSSQLPHIKLNQPVHIMVENTDEMLMGKIDFIEPTYKGESGTARLRIYLTNKNQKLKIGNLLTAEIEAGAKVGFWIPQSAVYDLGRDKIVFVKSNDVFKTRKVIIGSVSGKEIEIIGGLTQDDEVAENAQFMIDSESFVKVSK